MLQCQQKSSMFPQGDIKMVMLKHWMWMRGVWKSQKQSNQVAFGSQSNFTASLNGNFDSETSLLDTRGGKHKQALTELFKYGHFFHVCILTWGLNWNFYVPSVIKRRLVRWIWTAPYIKQYAIFVAWFSLCLKFPIYLYNSTEASEQYKSLYTVFYILFLYCLKYAQKP